MHELAVAQAIADAVSGRAEGRRVERVEVRIGHFRQVVPDSLLFSWALLTDGTGLAGCELVIEHVPAVISCGSCGAESTLSLPILLCATCDSSDVELITGEEFAVVSIDRARELA